MDHGEQAVAEIGRRALSGTFAHIAGMAFVQFAVGGSDGLPRGLIAALCACFLIVRFAGSYATARKYGSLRLRWTILAVGAIGTNLVWGGLLAGVRLHTGDSSESAITSLVVCGVATGAVIAFAPSRGIQGAALGVLIILPVAVTGIAGQSTTSFMVMHSVFFAYLVAQGRNANRDYWISVRSNDLLRGHAASAQLAATAADAMTQRLRDAQAQLVEASRLAGRSDVATAVLHNVGNVLNSVNVSATLVHGIIARSKTTILSKIATMITEQRADLARFFRDDPRGQKIPEYFAQLPALLDRDNAAAAAELVSLMRNIDHIKVIVNSQQSHLAPDAAVETFDVHELLDDALKFSPASCAQDAIEIVRHFDALPPARLDRHKALQILTNLLANARDAVVTKPVGDRRIVVYARRGADAELELAIEDNGCGIAPQDLAQIFQLGFTTKASGHGLGLHYSACAARELHGHLTASSAGIDRGAEFRLVLPHAA
jgi:signal transduction histidine kinase